MSAFFTKVFNTKLEYKQRVQLSLHMELIWSLLLNPDDWWLWITLLLLAQQSKDKQRYHPQANAVFESNLGKG